MVSFQWFRPFRFVVSDFSTCHFECCTNSTRPLSLSHSIQLATVRVKGGMSLRNGMWHELLNRIIMRNVMYVG